jgi:cellulose synthase/poly-beta-1,6-N-acetylglucosamine synthase-like glycosyltransferase
VHVNWHFFLQGMSWLYAISNIALAVFGFNIFVLLGLSIRHWRASSSSLPPLADADWPTVLVQLPIFNERYVVDRLIDAAVALDYPADRLHIQVLDDSTDDTTELAEARVAYYRSRGIHIEYHRRTERRGYKAGALADGLANAAGKFIAIFDADFVPPPDFLRRLIPEFQGHPRLGMVQARWGHLNPGQSMVTRAMALGFDEFFTVDQVARNGAGLFLQFNGSAGILRRACIEDAGGWQDDTLVEDMDLSYRAQLRGWQIKYRSDVVAPGELPSSIIALKQQQYRWAKGATQVLRKLGRQVLSSKRPLFQKIEGLLHLAGYLPHPLMIISILLSLPVVLLHGQAPIDWSVLGLAALAPPLAMLWGQFRLHNKRKMSWLYYPALLLIGVGLAVTDTRAIWNAFFGRDNTFIRTPKFGQANQRGSSYILPVDGSTWVELALALYGLATGLLALQRAPALIPFVLIYSAGFGYTALAGFWQSRGVRSLLLVKQLSTR